MAFLFCNHDIVVTIAPKYYALCCYIFLKERKWHILCKWAAICYIKGRGRKINVSCKALR